MYHKKKCLLIGLLFALPLFCLPAKEETEENYEDQITEGYPYRRTLEYEIRDLFRGNNFAELELRFTQAEIENLHFPEGHSYLYTYHMGLRSKYHVDYDGANWENYFSKIKAWKEQYPYSSNAQMAQIGAWISLAKAWHRSKNAEKADYFFNQAERALDRTWKEGLWNSQWHYLKLLHHIETRQPYPELLKLARVAYLYYPNYVHYSYPIGDRLRSLASMHHTNLQWELYAEDSIELPPTPNPSLYSRIYWGALGKYRHHKNNYDIDSERFLQGFEDMLERFPNSSWNQNHHAWYASQTNDSTLVRPLLEKIEGKTYKFLWQQKGRYENLLHWAQHPEEPITRTLQPWKRLSPARSSSTYRACVAYHPSLPLLASARTDGSLQLHYLDWNSEKHQQVFSTRFERDRMIVQDVLWSPNGSMLTVVLGSEHRSPNLGKVLIYKKTPKHTLELLHTSREHKTQLIAGVFTPDGKTLYYGGGTYNRPFNSKDGLSLYSYHLPSIKTSQHHVPEDFAATHLLVTRDGKHVLSFSRRAPIFINTSTHKIEHPVFKALPGKNVPDWAFKDKYWPWAMAFSPNGKVLALGIGSGFSYDWYAEGSVNLYDAKTGKLLHHCQQPEVIGSIHHLTFDSSGSLLVGGGNDGHIYCWDATNGKLLRSWMAHHTTKIASLSLSSDGTQLASTDINGEVFIWPIVTAIKGEQ